MFRIFRGHMTAAAPKTMHDACVGQKKPPPRATGAKSPKNAYRLGFSGFINSKKLLLAPKYPKFPEQCFKIDFETSSTRTAAGVLPRLCMMFENSALNVLPFFLIQAFISSAALLQSSCCEIASKSSIKPINADSSLLHPDRKHMQAKPKTTIYTNFITGSSVKKVYAKTVKSRQFRSAGGNIDCIVINCTIGAIVKKRLKSECRCGAAQRRNPCIADIEAVSGNAGRTAETPPQA